MKAFLVGKSRRADDVLDLIHADLHGLMRVESLAGKTFEHFIKFKVMVEKQSGKDLKVIQTDHGAYRLYDPTHEKIVVSRNVVFDESSSWKWDNDTEISNSQLKMEEEEEVLVENATNDTTSTSQAGSLKSTPNSLNSRSDSDASSRESMQNNKKFRSIDDIYVASPLILFAGDPLSVEEAIKKEEWQRAMEDELQAINKNMTQLPGFENFDDPNKVFRLKKALYGLKQAPRAWYTKIDEFFHKNGFERSEHKPTLYLKKQELGELRYFLGFEIVQTDACIFMSQKKYVEETLQKFNMVGCKTAFTPMNINENLKPEDGTGMVNGSLYRSLIGQLLYLTHSRPDISFLIGVLSQFMHKPSKHHFGATKRVLRYLAGTKEFGIWFRRTKDMNLKGFTDSDWVGSVEDRLSTSGNCFLIGSTAVS
ncbi:retrovirus-related pol polyprotein from transposon TNT 1-94 [Tanacetum coccineum]